MKKCREFEKYGWMLYRCRMCGKVEKNPHVPDVSLNAAFSIHPEIPTKDVIMGLFTLHSCEPGRVGIADLIGGRCEEKVKP